MMNTIWISNARARFAEVYGKERGIKVCNVVIPAIMGDFRKTALKAEAGRTITEQYRTDDRKTDVTVTGHKEIRNEQEERVVIEKLEVGGVPIPLGASALVI